VPDGFCAVCGADEAQKEPLTKIGNESYCELHIPFPRSEVGQSASDFLISLIGSDSASTQSQPPVFDGDLHIVGRNLDEINCSGLHIRGSLTIRGCKISGQFFLGELQVGGELRLEQCEFRKTCHMENARVGGNVYFTSNVFHDDAHFGGSKYAKVLVFNNNVAKKYVSFREVEFCDYVWFFSNSFEGYFNQIRSSFLREVFYDENRFYRVTTLDRCVFSRNVRISSCQFFHAPTFFDATLKETLLIDEHSTFLDVESPDAYDAYRILRVLFASQKMRREEGRFYALEQQALTKRQRNLVEKIIAIFYQWSSSYGTGLARSAFSLVLVNMAFFAYYVHIAPTRISAFDHHLKQVFVPFAIWNISPDKSELPLSIGLKLISSFHSLLTFIVISFFVLALTWRFKKD
jgi:hypothetical protein